MRKLKYVGAKPRVSHKGVIFDATKPDPYTFLSAALEILETLDEADMTKEGELVHAIRDKEYDAETMIGLIERYCDDVDAIFEEGEAQMKALIERYEEEIANEKRLNDDEKEAWLGNVRVMRDYFLQYMTNKRAYRCILEAIANRLSRHHIETLRVPLGRNYGLVLNDLISILQDHKPPFDATMRIEEKDGISYAVLDLNRVKPLDI